MADHEIVEMRHPAASSEEDRDRHARGAHARRRGVRHRPPPAGPQHRCSAPSACSACRPSCCCATSAPCARSTSASLQHTIWEQGHARRPRRGRHADPAAELEIGDLVNAAPEALFPTEENGYPELEGAELQVEKAKGAIIVVRMEPDEITPADGRENWTVDGDHLLLQDLHPRRLPDLPVRAHHAPRAVPVPPVDVRPGRRRQGRLRPGCPPLPQLPLAVDDEGYLIAQSDFNEPIGASYWEREESMMSIDTSKVASSNRTDAATASKPARPAAWPRGPTTASASATAMKKNLRKVFPDHWSFMLGEIALWSFVVLLLTGVFLTLLVQARRMGEVDYDGSYDPLRGVEMSEAIRLDAATSPSTCAAAC